MLEPHYGIWVPVGGNFGPLDTPDERTRSLNQNVEKPQRHSLYAGNPSTAVAPPCG
ncbi:MAG: hypothetical protein ICV54_03395 [Nostoc sp. C3-bin3]|nr:hypothetical protein [Nostoc sp. C3-bin3]